MLYRHLNFIKVILFLVIMVTVTSCGKISMIDVSDDRSARPVMEKTRIVRGPLATAYPSGYTKSRSLADVAHTIVAVGMPRNSRYERFLRIKARASSIF